MRLFLTYSLAACGRQFKNEPSPWLLGAEWERRVGDLVKYAVATEAGYSPRPARMEANVSLQSIDRCY